MIRCWSIFVVTLTLNFQGRLWNILYLGQKWSDCHGTKTNILIKLKASNVTIRFDLGHDLDLWIFKVKCDFDLWPHTWLWPWIAVISEREGRLTLNKGGGSRSFMTMTVTICWPRSGVRICQIVTGVTSDVGVPSTHVVYTNNGACWHIYWIEIYPPTKTYCSFKKKIAWLLILMQCINRLYLYLLL